MRTVGTSIPRTAGSVRGGCLLIGLLITGAAHADGSSPGYYVGAAVGDSAALQGYADESSGLPLSYPTNHFAWKLLAGARPISWFGGELEYIDFGQAQLGPAPLDFAPVVFEGSVHARSAAAFGVGYLPLPISSLELFGKLGVARVWAASSNAASCPGCSGAENMSVNGLAFGGGAQMHFGAFAVRAEYERVSTGVVGDPYLFSLGLTWRFL